MAKKEYIIITAEFTKGKGKKKYRLQFTDVRCIDDILKNESKYLPKNANLLNIGYGKKLYKN